MTCDCAGGERIGLAAGGVKERFVPRQYGNNHSGYV